MLSFSKGEEEGAEVGTRSSARALHAALQVLRFQGLTASATVETEGEMFLSAASSPPAFVNGGKILPGEDAWQLPTRRSADPIGRRILRFLGVCAIG